MSERGGAPRSCQQAPPTRSHSLLQTARGGMSTVHPRPPRPAFASREVFARPECARCLPFLSGTAAKDVPLEPARPVPVAFLLTERLWVSFPSCPLGSRLGDSFPPSPFCSALLRLQVTLTSREPRCVQSRGRAGSPGGHLVSGAPRGPGVEQSAFSQQVNYGECPDCACVKCELGNDHRHAPLVALPGARGTPAGETLRPTIH